MFFAQEQEMDDDKSQFSKFGKFFLQRKCEQLISVTGVCVHIVVDTPQSMVF